MAEQMHDYTKTIKIDLKLGDTKALKEVEKQVNQSTEETTKAVQNVKKLSMFSKESMKQFSDSFGKGIKEAYNEMVDPSKQGGRLANAMTNKLQQVLNKALEGLKKIFTDSLDEFNSIIGYSKLSNARTRELAFGYGLSGSQAYGFDKALELLGLSESDLPFMSAQEQAKFTEYFNKYTEKYNKLYDSGFFEDYIEYQYEMADFRQELQTEVIQFFMDNKDVIRDGMLAIMQLAKFTIQALGWLVQNFTGRASTDSERSAKTMSILDAASKTANVTIDQSFNNVSKADQTSIMSATSEVIKNATIHLKAALGI